MSPKVRLLLFCMLYFIPPATILVGWVDYEYRYHIMIPVILMTIAYAIQQRLRADDLGMRWDNFWEALAMQAGITVGATLLVVVLLHLGFVRQLADIPQSPWFYVMYAIISGPVQELTYRAIPFAELKKHDYLADWMKISLVIFLFSWLHVIYFDWIILIATLIIGTAWTVIYYWKPNYWAVSITHAVCGLLAISNGLV